MKSVDAWRAAYNQLELQLDRATFDTWVRPAKFLRHKDECFTIEVHNEMAQEMLQHRLYRNIRRVLSSVCGYNARIEFVVAGMNPAESVSASIESPLDLPLFQITPNPKKDVELSSPPLQNQLHELVAPPQRPTLPESDLNPQLTFDRFVTSGSNDVVYGAARAVVDHPGTAYNPLFIYGGVGLGKTHILQAIAHASQARGLNALYIPSEAFTNDLINAIRNRTTAMFREKYRSVDILVVDDIQFIAGKDTTQEEFFHTFNALVNFNKHVVIASDRHPSELKTLEGRLRSRFEGGLVADIQPPEFETRVAILQMWAQEQNISLDTDVIWYIAEKAPNNIRELGGVFNQIVAQSKLTGTVSLPTAETTLQHYARPREHLTIKRIVQITADYHGLSTEELVGKRRTSRVNHARQIAMYLAREMTDFSLPQIGKEFGRTHSTILHGCNKVADSLQLEPDLSQRIQKLQNIIRRGADQPAK